MKATFNQDQRFDELIAGYVIGDLNDRELAELESYDPATVAAAIERTELAAARALLVFESQAKHLEPLPNTLFQKVAQRTWSPFVSGNDLRLFESMESSSFPSPLDDHSVEQPKPAMEFRELLGWFAAIAATALAIAGWIPSRNENRGPELSRLGAPQKTSLDRAALLASADDLVRVAWTRPGDSSASPSTSDLGDVVWSPKFQKGYMRIRGLDRNDPAVEQYQLWILDPSRDSKPVDGGVFDIKEDGEVILPIHAKLHVDQPSLFAITVEKPGGVVVSDQSRLPLLAVVSK